VVWEYNPGCKIQAPLSYWGHYVISHREREFNVSYRPPGEHHHVGEFETLEEAKSAAIEHDRKEMAKAVGVLSPAARLKTWRLSRGLTQAQVAALLGVPKNTVSRWEQQARGLRGLYRRAVEELMSGEGNPTATNERKGSNQ
jgi:DNA-binding transcriptional regulator YiaG